MTKDIKYNLIKGWKKILSDYELVKSNKHPLFKSCSELYSFYDTSAKQVLKYRNKFLKSGMNPNTLLPDKRGSKFGTNRTPKGIERDIVKAYRRLGLNRYELVFLFEPIYKEKTPRPSTVSLIIRRYQKGISKKDKIVLKRYEKKYPGELGHIDAYYIPKSTLGPLKLKQGFLCSLVDDCTRLTYTEFVNNIKSDTVAGFLGRSLSFFYRNYGIRFDSILTDNGSEFRGKEFEFLIRYLKIKHKYTKPYRPQSNGKVEAFWKILGREFLYPNRYDNMKDLVYNLGEYLFQYTHHRRHGGINYQIPFEKFVLTAKNFTELLN